jgi:hypothetical protein
MPLTRLGIMPRCCSANPPSKAIPTTIQHCAVRPVTALVALCYPLSYGPGAAPSKEDDITLEKGMDACSTPAQDDVVTLDHEARLLRNHRSCAAIPNTAMPS